MLVSGLEAVESNLAIEENSDISALSLQNLIDCVPGETSENVLKFFKLSGVEPEKVYPLNSSRKAQCKFDEETLSVMIDSLEILPSGDEVSLMEAVAVSPVSVMIDASHPSFRSYKSGVYYEPECSEGEVNHAVIVVGYGVSSDGRLFWVIKNFWGTSWGVQGFAFIGIASKAVRPIGAHFVRPPPVGSSLFTDATSDFNMDSNSVISIGTISSSKATSRETTVTTKSQSSDTTKASTSTSSTTKTSTSKTSTSKTSTSNDDTETSSEVSTSGFTSTQTSTSEESTSGFTSTTTEGNDTANATSTSEETTSGFTSTSTEGQTSTLSEETTSGFTATSTEGETQTARTGGFTSKSTQSSKSGGSTKAKNQNHGGYGKEPKRTEHVHLPLLISPLQKLQHY